ADVEHDIRPAVLFPYRMVINTSGDVAQPVILDRLLGYRRRRAAFADRLERSSSKQVRHSRLQLNPIGQVITKTKTGLERVVLYVVDIDSAQKNRVQHKETGQVKLVAISMTIFQPRDDRQLVAKIGVFLAVYVLHSRCRLLLFRL